MMFVRRLRGVMLAGSCPHSTLRLDVDNPMSLQTSGMPACYRLEDRTVCDVFSLHRVRRMYQMDDLSCSIFTFPFSSSGSDEHMRGYSARRPSNM